MALGLQPSDKSGRCAVLRILEDAAASAAPTIVDPANQRGLPGSGAGVAIPRIPGRYKPTRESTLVLHNTDGTGAVTLGYLRLRVWSAAIGLWLPLGPGSEADKGKINRVNSYGFGVSATNRILHTEFLAFPGHFDAIHAELGAVGGTGTPKFNLDLLIPIYQDLE